MPPSCRRAGAPPARRAPPARWRPALWLGALLALALLGALDAASGTVAGHRAAPEQAFLARHWQRPLAPQGPAPEGWTALERTLAPEACGTCHGDRYEEWRHSLHAHAFSPGLVGQLLTFDPPGAARCLDCHAPLAEQRIAFEAARAAIDGPRALVAKGGLAAGGVVCAACHVRRYRRYGPPKRGTGETGQSDPSAPHGGVFRTAAFEDSRFCASCHQFPQSAAVNGKPLENTYEEWRASPQARRGETCQRCHMPDRRHLWRGIHDPDTVARALRARFAAEPRGAVFALESAGVGHAFPTYVTPRVVMRGAVLDAKGRPRPETLVEHVIQRVVRFRGGRWVEVSDSRLAPGETARLVVPWRGGVRVRVWLEVHPDDFYDHRVYDALRARLPEKSAPGRLIREADRRAEASAYRLFETEIVRP